MLLGLIRTTSQMCGTSSEQGQPCSGQHSGSIRLTSMLVRYDDEPLEKGFMVFEGAFAFAAFPVM